MKGGYDGRPVGTSHALEDDAVETHTHTHTLAGQLARADAVEHTHTHTSKVTSVVPVSLL